MIKFFIKQNIIKLKILTILLVYSINCNVLADEAYFDLSENEIQIQTNFIGKEIIIFGILQNNQDTIITIKGPEKNTKILKKERVLGLWFNTKRMVYKKLPSLFFLASSSPIKEILNHETIIKKKLYFNELLTNSITERNFIEKTNLNIWSDNLIKIKKSSDLFKEYSFKNIDNKLFQTRIFFPANSIPGNYSIKVYQIKNKLIINEKERIINIKKSGIGEKIYNFAHLQPATYGLLTIFFAILSGFLAATIFRRL